MSMRPRGVLVVSVRDGSSYAVSQVQLGQALRLGLRFAALVIGERYQAAVGQIAELAHGTVAHELGDVLADAGDAPNVRLLDVEVERPRDGILAVGDRVEVRRDAVDVRALNLVRVLLEKAE